MIAMLTFCVAHVYYTYDLNWTTVECFAGNDQFLTKDLLNTYCMAENLYTVRQRAGPSGRDRAVEIYPGIPAHYRGYENDIKYHSYYRYTTLYLFLQAFFFSLPICLWEYLERGHLANIIQDLNNSSGQNFDEKRLELIKHSASAIKSMKNTTAYAAKYYFCMMINLLNVLVQFIFTHWFINEGEFLYYGSDVLNYYTTSVDHKWRNEENVNFELISPMKLVFPRHAKCRVFIFGLSETVLNKEVLCIMPMNIFNDKMFLAIWFWFIILAAITALSIAYGLCYYAFHMIKMWKKPASTGDLFILSLIEQNVDQITFGKIVEELELMTTSKRMDKVLKVI